MNYWYAAGIRKNEFVHHRGSEGNRAYTPWRL